MMKVISKRNHRITSYNVCYTKLLRTFQVSSKTDSRTIIDTNGAENLLGDGDMLFLPPGTAKLQRIHGAFISEEELSRIIGFLKNQKTPEYDQTILKAPPKEEDESDTIEYDERYDDAVALSYNFV